MNKRTKTVNKHKECKFLNNNDVGCYPLPCLTEIVEELDKRITKLEQSEVEK